MNELQNSFDHSFTAWEEWNLTNVEYRYELLNKFVGSLPTRIIAAGRFQLNQSQKVTSKVYQLVGPTGETNELYVAGRGVAILAIDSVSDQSHCAAIALLVSMLAAGNSVIVCCDDATLVQLLITESVTEKLCSNIVQCLPFDSYKELLNKDIKSFAFVGNTQAELEINTLLALRTGAITALVSETDLDGLPQSQDPKLVLRFITERTRTINITAVGGNATLLELGSETR